MGDKQPYFPEAAIAKIQEHAAHFAGLVTDALAPSLNGSVPPILCAPFDAELFGHWWFEGALWLEAVARHLHDHPAPAPIQLISCAEYLDLYPPSGTSDHISLHEGSWGAAGGNQVWLNPETAWTYTHIYPAELFLRDVVTLGRWQRLPTQHPGSLPALPRAPSP